MTTAAIVVIDVLYPTEAEAADTARRMIARHLAACVNIGGPCHSVYRWDGRIEEQSEYRARFKTSAARAPALMAAIAALHSYRVPAITLGHEQATAAYAAWVAAETGDPDVVS